MAAEVIDRLEAVVGQDHVLRSRASLVSYAVDATVGYRGEPLAAVFPGTANETARVLRLARETGITVVGRGAGTSLSAGAVPPKGSIVVSLSRLRSGPYVDREALTVSAGAGSTTLEVQSAAKAAGLFYPPDPSSQDVTTVGGNAATNAGGPHALKYGVTRDYITGLEVADCSGSVARYSRGTPGEMMVDLMIGSEGTLGLVTEVKARLIPAPEGFRTVTATFDSAQAAAQATVDLLDTGVIPGKLEFMDDVSIRAVQAARDRGLSLGIGALLLIELHGDRESLLRDGAVTQESLKEVRRRGRAGRRFRSRAAAGMGSSGGHHILARPAKAWKDWRRHLRASHQPALCRGPDKEALSGTRGSDPAVRTHRRWDAASQCHL